MTRIIATMIISVISLFLQSILCIQIFVGFVDEVDDDGNKDDHSDQTAEETGTESAGGDQCANLVDGEA